MTLYTVVKLEQVRNVSIILHVTNIFVYVTADDEISGFPLLPEGVEEDVSVKSETAGPGVRGKVLPMGDKCARMDKSNIILLGPTGCGK